MNRIETDNGEEATAGVNVRAVAELPADLAILRMENENICSLAAARPRNHKKIRENLLSQIDAYPSFAREVMYCKPVGKDQGGRMQYARGLSVRAAEAVAEAYGYCRVRADVIPLPDGRMKIEATFTDYQSGRIWQDSGIVSPNYRGKGGRMMTHSEDRFLNVVLKAEKSKLLREVILRSVPPGLRSELMELTEQKLDELLDDKTVQKIVANFASLGVTEETLSEHLGRSVRAGWTKQDRQDLLGLWNAIKSEETTVAEAFGQPKKEEPPKSGGAVSGADLTGGKATAEPKPEPTGSHPPTTSEPATGPGDQPSVVHPPAGAPVSPKRKTKGEMAKEIQDKAKADELGFQERQAGDEDDGVNEPPAMRRERQPGEE